MGQNRFIIAGWLAVLKAILTVPFAKFTVGLTLQPGSEGRPIAALVTVIGLALFIFIFLAFRDFLNNRFDFHGTDVAIILLIWINSAGVGFTLLGLLFPNLEELSGLLTALLLMALGMAFIFFALKLLHLSDNLQGMQKPLVYTSSIMGVCFATIKLIPFAVFTSVFTYILLGFILLQLGGHKEE